MFFPKSKDLQVAFEVIANCLKIQIGLAFPQGGKEAEEKLSKDQSLGYIFGFTDGFLQALKIKKDEDRMKLLITVYSSIFPENQVDDLVDKTLSLQMDTDFNFSREIGGKQAIDFLRSKKSPMGLSHLLFDHPLETVYGEK